MQLCALITYWMNKHFVRTDAPRRAEALGAAEWLFGVVALDCGAGVASGRPDSGEWRFWLCIAVASVTVCGPQLGCGGVAGAGRG